MLTKKWEDIVWTVFFLCLIRPHLAFGKVENRKHRNSSNDSASNVGPAIYASPILGLGINPTNLTGVIGGFEFTEKASVEVGSSYSGARTKSLGNALIMGARVNSADYSKDRFFGVMHLWRYAGSGQRTIAFDKKIKEYRPGGGTCDPGECDSFNVAPLEASWAYYYASIGGGFEMPVFESANVPVKLFFGAGLAYCFSASLKTDDSYDALMGSPMGVEIDRGILGGNQAIVKKGDFGPYAIIGLEAFLPTNKL